MNIYFDSFVIKYSHNKFFKRKNKDDVKDVEKIFRTSGSLILKNKNKKNFYIKVANNFQELS